jgi:uncharacterized membrane protein YcaP (DUF421 family)
MENLFFTGWESMFRTLVVGVFGYIAVIFMLRISGRRTLSKMNAFDFVVTVALGSTLATILLSKDVALLDGIVAFGILIGLQFVISWLIVRHEWVRRLATGEPIMLLYHGNFLPEALLKARVSRDEVCAAVRGAGEPSLQELEAVVLETDGSLSVVRKGDATGSPSLKGIRRVEG